MVCSRSTAQAPSSLSWARRSLPWPRSSRSHRNAAAAVAAAARRQGGGGGKAARRQGKADQGALVAALDELQAGQGQVLAAQDAGFADLKAELAVLRAGLAAPAGGGAAAASAGPFAGLTPLLDTFSFDGKKKEAHIGRGATTVTYRMRHKHHGQLRAVKMVGLDDAGGRGHQRGSARRADVQRAEPHAHR
jgi:hypothetical protein